MTSLRAEIGDLIVIEGHRVGEGRRMGEILEVLGAPGEQHFRVRWEDGRETLFYPGGDARVIRVERAPEEVVLRHEP